MKNFYLLLVCTCSMFVAHSQTWTGITNADWNDPTNWNPNNVPTAASSVNIPSSGITNWPRLSADITIGQITESNGSRMDVNGHTITINYNGNTSGIAGIINNSNATANPITITYNDAGNSVFYINEGANINADINVTVTGNCNLDMDNGGTASVFNGNATINIASTGWINIAHNVATSFMHNLTINRTVAGASLSTIFNKTCKVDGNFIYNNTGGGSTYIFQSGGTVGGNFSCTHSAGGDIKLGCDNNSNIYKTKIAGQFNANINYIITAGNPLVYIQNIQNVSGGDINIQYPGTTRMLYDSLSLDSINISGLVNAMDFNGNILNVAAFNLADSSTDDNATGFLLRNNKVIGNTIFTINTVQPFREGVAGADTFSGNATFNINGIGECRFSENNPSIFNGNLTINRTAAGVSNVFMAGGNVGNDFSYTNNVGGNVTLGNSIGNVYSFIGRKFNANINYSISAGNPQVYIQTIANGGGGSINIQYPGYTLFKNDSFNVASVTVNGLINGMDIQYSTLNVIAFNITDSSTDAFTNGLLFRGNKMNANTIFTINTVQPFREGVAAVDTFFNNATFNVNSSGVFKLSENGGSVFNGNLTVNGTNWAAGNYTFGHITFSGSGSDSLTCNQPGFTLPDATMQKTKGSSITLTQPTIIPGSFVFNNGNIISTAANPLTFNNGVHITNVSDSSHVIGAVYKTGNQPFTFPIGDSTKYFPVSISAPANTSDEFMAEYKETNPSTDGYDTAAKATTLARIAAKGYWDVQRISGTSNVNLTLGYNYPNAFINDMTALRVAHWNGSLWEDLGNGGTTGNDTIGTVITASAVKSFSPFAIATTDVVSNPLPVNLTFFNAEILNNTTHLTWHTSSEINNNHFEIERSVGDTKHFTSVGTVAGKGTSLEPHDYSFIDYPPNLNQTNYYRLKQIDDDGKYTYSGIESVTFTDNPRSLKAYPNPAKEYININPIMAGTLCIYDVHGELIKTQQIQVGNNVIDVHAFAPGMYFGVTDEGKFKFIKE